MESVTIYPKVSRIFLFGAISLGFIVIGLLLIYGDPLRPSQLRRIAQTGVGILGVLFGLFGAGALGFQLLTGKYHQQIVQVSQDGIHYYQDGTLIGWDDIQSIELYKIGGNRGITVNFKPDSSLGASHVDINLTLANAADYERVVATIQRALKTKGNE